MSTRNGKSTLARRSPEKRVSLQEIADNFKNSQLTVEQIKASADRAHFPVDENNTVSADHAAILSSVLKDIEAEQNKGLPPQKEGEEQNKIAVTPPDKLSRGKIRTIAQGRQVTQSLVRLVETQLRDNKITLAIKSGFEEQQEQMNMLQARETGQQIAKLNSLHEQLESVEDQLNYINQKPGLDANAIVMDSFGINLDRVKDRVEKLQRQEQIKNMFSNLQDLTPEEQEVILKQNGFSSQEIKEAAESSKKTAFTNRMESLNNWLG